MEEKDVDVTTESKTDNKYVTRRFSMISPEQMEMSLNLDHHNTALKQNDIYFQEYYILRSNHTDELASMILNDMWSVKINWDTLSSSITDPLSEQKERYDVHASTLDKLDLINTVVDEFMEQNKSDNFMLYSLLLHSIIHHFNNYIREDFLSKYMNETQILKQNILRICSENKFRPSISRNKKAILQSVGMTISQVQRVTTASLNILRKHQIVKE